MAFARKLARRYFDWRSRTLPASRWATTGVAVIVAVHNRSGQRVENFLRTLRRQTLPPDYVDLTLCDYGSEPEHARDLRERCWDWRARYVHLPPIPDRRRAVALNAALRQVPEWIPYVVSTDIDMLFAPNFLETVARVLRSFPPALALCRFIDLPEGSVAGETDVTAEFERLRALGELYDDSAVGPCLAAPREWFHHIRGFDERLFGEDHDDYDIQRRARLSGLVETWVHDRTALLHQWHWRRFDQPRTPEELAEHERYRRHWERNRDLVLECDDPVRNRDHEWGALPEGSEVIEPPERRRSDTMPKLFGAPRPARLRRDLRRSRCARAAAHMPRERLVAECLAVVVPVLDREGWRTRNFLRTLRAQSLPPACLDITVVDFGSRPDQVAELELLCAEHRARLVALPPGGAEWNKSHALNVGLRHVPETARFVLPTDVDMLFAPNFAEELLRAHLAWGAALVLCEFRDLPREALAPETDVVAEFEALAALGEWAGDHAVGPCLSATRAWYHRLRGFDERMRRWGFMDLDIVRRAELDGLPLVRVEQRTALLHQWHARKWDVYRDDPVAQEAMRRQYEANRRIYESDASVVRNPEAWGEAPEGTRVVEPAG